MRDWEPHVALVGDGATEALARGAHDVLRAGRLRSCSRSATARRRQSPRCSRSSATRDVAITRDLAGRERVVEGALVTSSRRARSRRSAAGRARRSSRPTPSTGSCATPYREEPVAPALRAEGPRRARSRRRSSPPTSSCSSSACPSCAAAAARSRARCCPGPYTLVLPNPARRFRWLTGARPGHDRRPRPELDGPAREVLDARRRGRRDEREPARRRRSATRSTTCPTESARRGRASRRRRAARERRRR